MPLAIELAAARAAALGVEQFAARLDDRFNLLAGGRRTALPRQQTLRATFDWSYELLTEPERAVLRYLSVFVGSLTLEADSRIRREFRVGRHRLRRKPGRQILGHSGCRYRSALSAARDNASLCARETPRNGGTRRRCTPTCRILPVAVSASRGQKPRHDPQSNGLPSMASTSITCGLRWTGPSRRAATSLRALWGLWVQSHQQRGVPSGAHARATVLHGPAGSGWPGRRAHWRAYAWDVPVLPGRSEQCSSSSRAHAQPLHGSPASVPYDPVSIRPAGGRARHSCKGALAAGISGSGHAHGKGQCRGCSRHCSCGFGLAVLRRSTLRA